MHQFYGVDLSDRTLLPGRSWRWFKLRVVGLLSIESRLASALRPPDPKPKAQGKPKTAYDDPVPVD